MSKHSKRHTLTHAEFCLILEAVNAYSYPAVTDHDKATIERLKRKLNNHTEKLVLNFYLPTKIAEI